MPINRPQTIETKTQTSQISWIKKLGVVGFLFFLLKGLLWLLIPALLVRGCV